MSDTMLHGVLNIPPELWRDDLLDKAQRHARYVEASERIKKLELALQNIKKHQEVIAVGHERMTAAWVIADKALNGG